MPQSGIQVLKDSALTSVSANASQLMVTGDFRDQLVRIPLFTASLAGQFVQEKAMLSEGIALHRQETSRRHQEVTSLISNWVFGQGSVATNQARVQRVLDQWQS